MRLESIALHGFKSFGDKTVVRILPGITGIVGPNGCGKSNVGEAVRWALGEQSAKSLRGQRMEDLIFHGSQSRKPVGLAEVELTFRNDGTLSVPWAEVSVARRLYRTGESEYLLNNSAARLRDILDLFAGTGANPRAYSVIDQDKLNHVLTAKPHDRRVFIEEAAGIARYKQQRNETQGKLDATKQNLVRVRDVMDEVKRQLSSLERQAKKAQQYKALQTTKRDLSLVVLAAEYMARVAEGERRAAELSHLRDQEQTLRTRAAQLAAQEAQQRERLQESDHRLSDLRQSGQKVQGELERLLERREQMGVQLRELAEEALRLDEETRATADRLGAIVGEREVGRQALAEASRLTEECVRTADALAAALERHRETLAAERDRAEATRLEQVRVAAERVDLMRHAGELRERAAQLRRRAERLAAELSDATAEAAGIDALRASLVQARDAARGGGAASGRGGRRAGERAGHAGGSPVEPRRARGARTRPRGLRGGRPRGVRPGARRGADGRRGNGGGSPRGAARHGARDRGGPGRAPPVGGGGTVRARARGGRVPRGAFAGGRHVSSARAPPPADRAAAGRERRALGGAQRGRAEPEPRPPPPRAGRDRRAPRPGRGSVAAERRGGDVCHVGRRGARADRTAPRWRPGAGGGRRALATRAQAPAARARRRGAACLDERGRDTGTSGAVRDRGVGDPRASR